MAQFIPRFPLDLSGKMDSNLVRGEHHKLTANVSYRTVVPRAGAYYTDSLIIRDASSGDRLEAEKHYKAIQYYEEPSMRSGQEVCASILILPDGPSEVEIEYQAVGGEFEAIVPVIEKALESIEDFHLETASWGDLLDKPDVFPPAPHLHRISDLYGFEHVVASLERIREVLLYQDIAAREVTSDPDEIADETIMPRHLNKDEMFAFPRPIYVTSLRAEAGEQIHIDDADLMICDEQVATRQWVSDTFGDTEQINFSDWNEAYEDSIVSVSGNGNGELVLTSRNDNTLTTDLAHTHDYEDLPFEKVDRENWDEAYSKAITSADLSSASNGDLQLTLDQNDGDQITASVSYEHPGLVEDISGTGGESITIHRVGEDLTLDISHNHDDRYTRSEDLAAVATSGHFDDISGMPDTSLLQEAVDGQITGISGDGNSTLELTREDGSTLTKDLSHTHDNELTDAQGDGNGDLTLYRRGDDIVIDLSHNHDDRYTPSDELSDVATTGDYQDLKNKPSFDANTAEDAYNKNIVSADGSGNGELTLVRRDESQVVADLAHEHGYADLPITEDQVANWDETHSNSPSQERKERWDTAYNRSVTKFEAELTGGDASNATLQLAFSREDESDFEQEIDLTHDHDFDQLPISSDDVDKWNTAHGKSLEDIEGDGNSPLNLTLRDGTTLTTNLEHYHDQEYLARDNNLSDLSDTSEARKELGVPSKEEIDEQRGFVIAMAFCS